MNQKNQPFLAIEPNRLRLQFNHLVCRIVLNVILTRLFAWRREHVNDSVKLQLGTVEFKSESPPGMRSTAGSHLAMLGKKPESSESDKELMSLTAMRSEQKQRGEK